MKVLSWRKSLMRARECNSGFKPSAGHDWPSGTPHVTIEGVTPDGTNVRFQLSLDEWRELIDAAEAESGLKSASPFGPCCIHGWHCQGNQTR